MKHTILLMLALLFVPMTTIFAQSVDTVKTKRQLIELAKLASAQTDYAFKTNGYPAKEITTSSGDRYCFVYKNETYTQPFTMYMLTAQRELFFDLQCDGIVDGWYVDDKLKGLVDTLPGEAWLGARNNVTSSPEALEIEVDMMGGSSMMRQVDGGFKFWDLRFDTVVIYDTYAKLNEPKITPSPSAEDSKNARILIQNMFKKVLDRSTSNL